LAGIDERPLVHQLIAAPPQVDRSGRVWQDLWRRLDRPRLALWFPHVVTAIVLHGLYNAFAVALAVGGVTF